MGKAWNVDREDLHFRHGLSCRGLGLKEHLMYDIFSCFINISLYITVDFH